MSRWHPAAVLLIGFTATGVLGAWFYAYMNGNLSTRDLAIGPLAWWQTRMLLRIGREA